MERQLSLFKDPHRLPVAPRDPNAAPEAAPRLSRQSRAILGLLRGRPRSNAELAKVTHRFGARLYDLRRARCVIETAQDARSGLATYTLTHEPEGLI